MCGVVQGWRQGSGRQVRRVTTHIQALPPHPLGQLTSEGLPLEFLCGLIKQ